MRRILESQWLATRLQVIIGVVFVWASLHKIADPPDFAKMVFNYKITPCQLINLAAIYMPWIEIAAGAALILGLRGRRGGAAIVGALLLVFIGAIGINLLRGNPIECGCFEGSGPPKTRDELFFDMWVVLLRDVAMVLGIIQIFIAEHAAAVRKALAATRA